MTQTYDTTAAGVMMPRRTLILGALATGALGLVGCQTTDISDVPLEALPKPAPKLVEKPVAAPPLLKYAGMHKRLGRNIDLLVPKAKQTFSLDGRSSKVLGKFNYASRDFGWSDRTPTMDDKLLDFVAALLAETGAPYVRINSAYRTQAHQNYLRRRGLTRTKHSKHTKKKALDVGETAAIKNRHTRIAAAKFGLHYYSRGRFTHVNT